MVVLLFTNKYLLKQNQVGGTNVWGHGVPLTPIVNRELYGQQIPTLSSMNLEFGPQCCPSQYSTDRGCVCYHAPK